MAAEGTGRSQEETRQSVMDGVARQDRRAWERFFEIYGSTVFRFARRAGLQPYDAEEVVANVMRNLFVAFRNGFTYDPEVGRFRHYLKRVTNRVISAVRANQPLGQSYDPAELLAAPEPDADAAEWRSVEKQERLRACLVRLRHSGEASARDLEAFERFALQEESAEKVAADLDVTTNRLYSIKHEMLKKLRAIDRGLTRILGEV